jgi:UDP-N-acetylglucosamine transferase subunit ALG13
VIFVTVGTSLPHDALIQKIDELAESGAIADKVVAQIGEGTYQPRTIESFRFAPGLEQYFERADVIVSNCGAGTIMENVTRGRRLVTIKNPNVTGGHEWELLKKMTEGGYLIWCRKLEHLKECIRQAKSMEFSRFQPERLKLPEVLAELLT